MNVRYLARIRTLLDEVENLKVDYSKTVNVPPELIGRLQAEAGILRFAVDRELDKLDVKVEA